MESTIESVPPLINVSRRIFKDWRPGLLLRLIAICFFGWSTTYLIFTSEYWMLGIWTTIIFVALFYETANYMHSAERKLTVFLQALSQDDFSITFNQVKSSHQDLHVAFNQLTQTFKDLRSKKESQHQFLHVIVETAAVPLLCFEENDDKVYLINDAAKRFFNIPFLQSIKSLSKVDPMLPGFVRNISDGKKESLKMNVGNKTVFLAVTSQHLIFENKNLKLIAFHDLSSELAAREAETWQKLLRVLTHEISNSAIPLTTLSAYVHDVVMAADGEIGTLPVEKRRDLLLSLKTIEQRSRSLKEFVLNFRKVNQVPEPYLEQISVTEILSEVCTLFAEEIRNENVKVDISHSEQGPNHIYADRNLTMQVLINIIKNSMESMYNFKANKNITIRTEKTGRYKYVYIKDTGCGIDESEVDQIFIPFYSTKKNGSGIGLSISQQIMHKQKGDITVRSKLGCGTEFMLAFLC